MPNNPQATSPVQKTARALDPNILVPGDAGDLLPAELEHIRDQLRANPDLRYAWGFQRRRKTFPPALVRELALRGSPDRRGENVAIIRAWRQQRREKGLSRAA